MTNKYLQNLIEVGGVETTARDWYLKTYAIDETLRKFAVATFTALEIMTSPFKGRIKMIHLHSEDVDLGKISLGDVLKDIGLASTSAELSTEGDYLETVQFSFGELRLETWDRGFPCLHAVMIADGGPPSDYFVFMVER